MGGNPLSNIDPLGLYMPTNLPKNCWIVILGENTHENIKTYKGEWYVEYKYFLPIIWMKIKPFKIKKEFKYLEKGMAREIGTISTKTTSTQYYVRCKKTDKCGEISYENLASGGPHIETEITENFKTQRKVLFKLVFGGH